MSTMTRAAVLKDLAKVNKLLEDTSDKKAELEAEIRELTTSMNGIKNAKAKQVLQKEVDALTEQLNAPDVPKPHQQYKAELKSLADGYTKILAVMENIPFYMTAQRGRVKGVKVAKQSGKPRGRPRKNPA